MKRVLFSSVICTALCHSTTAFAREETLSLPTATGVLHGSLTLPDAENSAVVALIIAGSGPTDRNGNSPTGRNDSLRMLAESLAAHGIASLRFDKRGIGASSAALSDESKVVFRDLVADASAWIERMQIDPRFAAVVVVGHSEGSTIGMLASARSDISAFVSIAGPSLRASQGLRTQLAGKLSPHLAEASEKILLALESGKTSDTVPEPLRPLFRPSVQPYLIDWFAVTPTEEIKKLRVPVLIIQGGTDIQVPVTAARALHEASPQSQLFIIEGMNHIMKSVPNDRSLQIASYRDPSLPLTPALTDAIVTFVKTATKH